MNEEKAVELAAKSEPNELLTLMMDPGLKDRIDAAKASKKTVKLVSKYLNFEKDKPLYLVFAGIITRLNEADPETGEITNWRAAQFLDESGQIFENAGVQLIKACSQIKPGQPVKITLVGEEKVRTGDGRVKIYNIEAVLI